MPTLIGTPAWTVSRSLRQISRCSSPAPATTYWPSSVVHWKHTLCPHLCTDQSCALKLHNTSTFMHWPSSVVLWKNALCPHLCTDQSCALKLHIMSTCMHWPSSVVHWKHTLCPHLWTDHHQLCTESMHCVHIYVLTIMSCALKAHTISTFMYWPSSVVHWKHTLCPHLCTDHHQLCTESTHCVHIYVLTIISCALKQHSMSTFRYWPELCTDIMQTHKH